MRCQVPHTRKYLDFDTLNHKIYIAQKNGRGQRRKSGKTSDVNCQLRYKYKVIWHFYLQTHFLINNTQVFASITVQSLNKRCLHVQTLNTLTDALLRFWIQFSRTTWIRTLFWTCLKILLTNFFTVGKSRIMQVRVICFSVTCVPLVIKKVWSWNWTSTNLT